MATMSAKPSWKAYTSGLEGSWKCSRSWSTRAWVISWAMMSWERQV